MEERHIAYDPEGEREEIRQIFANKGFEGRALEDAVETITQTHERWIDTMMTEEHGLPPVTRSPAHAAAATFLAFFLCGFVPIFPFLFGLPATLALSTILTGLTFFYHRLPEKPLVACGLVARRPGDRCNRIVGRGRCLCRRQPPKRHRLTADRCCYRPPALCATMAAMSIQETKLYDWNRRGIPPRRSRHARPRKTSHRKELLAACEDRLEGQVSPEFLRSQIEIGTKVCRSIPEARAELSRLRSTVAEVADGFGLAPIAASTHPFARWTAQHHTDKERYHALADDLQVVVRRMVICGMHVHIGIEDDELRIDLMKPARLLPSASSGPVHLLPLLAGRAHGLEVLPPVRLRRVAAHRSATTVHQLQRVSANYPGADRRRTDRGRHKDLVGPPAERPIPDHRNARHRRLPVARRYDVQSRPSISASPACSIVCGATISAGVITCRFLVNENRWRAQRYGVEDGLVDFGKGATTPFAGLVEELLVLVDEDAGIFRLPGRSRTGTPDRS